MPINGGLIVDAYHTPEFSSNIVSVRILAKTFEIVFSEHIRSYPACILMRPKTFEIIQDFPLIDDLYPIKLNKTKVKILQTRKLNYSPEDWHKRVGHPSPERYLKLSEIFPEIPKFDRPTLQSINCAPCLMGRLKRAPINRSRRNTTHPLELIHLDISGKVEPSLGGNMYTIGFLDDFTAKSDVIMIKSKGLLYENLV